MTYRNKHIIVYSIITIIITVIFAIFATKDTRIEQRETILKIDIKNKINTCSSDEKSNF
jgi:hypothetical protein